MATADVSAHGDNEPLNPPLSSNSESMSFAGQLYVPRLSPRQAIVWLAVAIVPIAFHWAMWTIGIPDIKHLPHGHVVVADWWTRMSVYFSIASFAACFVTSCILIRSQCFRMLGRLQPGHWIVLLLTFGGILGRVATPFSSMSYASPHGWAQHTFTAILWFTILAVGGFGAFAAMLLRDATRWKVLLVLASAGLLLWTIPFMPFSMSMKSDILRVYVWALPCCAAILVATAVVAVVIDWPRRASRDWPHWLGVSLLTLGSFVMFVQTAVTLWRWAGH